MTWRHSNAICLKPERLVITLELPLSRTYGCAVEINKVNDIHTQVVGDNNKNIGGHN